MARSGTGRESIGLPSSYARLQALYELGQAVGRAEKLEDAYAAALDGLISVLGVDRASILRFDEAGVMRFVAWRGISDGYRAAVDGHTPWGPADVDARPIPVEDVERESSLADVRRVILAEGIRACAFVPLVHGGRLVGKFMLYYDEPHVFRDEELRLAETVAAQIAAASERRRAEEALRVSRDQLQLILDVVTDGITLLDPEGRVLYANETAARLAGATVEEFRAGILGRYELVAEDGTPLPAEELPTRYALRGETPEPRTIGFRVLGAGEPLRWSNVMAVPVRGPDGSIDAVTSIFRDVTEEVAAEARLRLLAEAGRRLGSSLDVRSTLQAVAQLAVPTLCDLCLVHLVGAGARLERVALSAADEELARGWLSFEEHRPAGAEGPGPAVASTGRSFLVPDLEPVSERPDAASGSAADLRQLGVRGFVAVPLVARTEILGVLTLAVTDRTARTLEERDLELAEELGRRAGVAVENARLFREAQDSYARLEALLESAPIGIGLFDRELRCLHANDALAGMLGVPSPGYAGRNFEELIPVLEPELGPVVRRVAGGEEAVVGIELSSPGTGVRSWSVGVFPVRRADGDTIGVGVLVEDVTERRAAEAERAQLLAREQDVRATLERLGEVTEVALTHLALEDLLPSLLETIVRVLGADTGAILLREDDRLFVRAEVGFDEVVERAIPVPIGQGMAGTVAATQTPVVIRELREIRLVSPMLLERGIHSLVAIPLRIGHEVIGVVHVGSEQPARFGTEDVRLLSLVADRIALAINQSGLYGAQRTASERFGFLAEASEMLGSSLDYEATLSRVAELAVPRIADWCVVDVLGEDESIARLAVVHRDPAKVRLAHELEERLPPDRDARGGVPAVIRTGEPEFVPEVTDELLVEALAGRDPEPLRLLRELGLVSAMTVPLTARGRTLGAITFASAESGRRYGEADLELALELARRAGAAVDNSRLFRDAEERAQAARVLATVGDGVVLVDDYGVVRYWNRAAEAITGLPADEVVGRPAVEALPGWAELAPRPQPATPAASAAAQTIPLVVEGRELWLSVTGVGFEDGVVYAFRDLTEERALEQMRSEFVATVSHELRTPLAAIYGAAMTLQRTDLTLGDAQRESLLSVIAAEADRLARTVNDILWASRIDTEQLRITIESCDAGELAAAVVRAQRAHLPGNIEVSLETPDALPAVAADPDKVRQVLVNLVDNAVKYSPDGGHVEVTLSARGGTVRFSVRDEGLGIPAAEQGRIFEKFYRLDPQMTRGVGGTGLGLYICRELVRRMGGRIWVESEDETGSSFHVELPVSASEAEFEAHIVA